jgi:hypothetical protein
VGLVVVLIGTTSWAFYARSHTGSFPLPIKKLVAAFHRISPPQPSSVKPEESAGHQPSSVSNQTSQKSTVNDPTGAGTSSGTQASGATNNGERTQTAPESSGAPTVPSQEPIAGQSSSSQLASESAHASEATTSVPSAPGQTQAPQSSSASGQPVVAPSPTAIKQHDSDKEQPLADSTSPPNAPAANGDSAKAPVTLGSGESPTDEATKGLKKLGPKPTSTVDGFSRNDVPELLRQADAAAGRSDYRLARYEYNLILKLDRSNTTARAGLHRVQAAEQSH